MRCPDCHAYLEEGYLSVKEGLNWLRCADTPTGLQFAEGIRGTNAIMRSNRLAAWRCRKCELVLFAHGNRHEQAQREREEATLANRPPEEPPESTS